MARRSSQPWLPAVSANAIMPHIQLSLSNGLCCHNYIETEGASMATENQSSQGVSMDVSRLLEDGIALARRGERREAQSAFRRVIQKAPELEDGWLWMAWLSETREQSLRYLREGLRFAPQSERLTEAIAWVQTHKPAAPAETAPSAAGQPQPVRAERRARQTRRAHHAPAPKRTAAPWRTGALSLRIQGLGQVASRSLDTLRSVSLTAFSLGAIVLLLLLGALALANLGGKGAPVVSALVLPTPVLDATPTPGVEQLTRPYWTKVEIAWGQEDWETAINTLEQIRTLDPNDPNARKRLSETLYFRAQASIQANELEAAKRDLDRAIRLDADSQHLQAARQDVELYRDAVEAYLEQDWARAVFLLTQVHQRTPDFRDTRTMLGQAHCNLAEQQLQADNLDEALAQAQLCEEVLQEDPEASEMVQRVMETIKPPRRIEVSLSKFRTTVYENNEPIREFPICHGRPSHPTKTGRFVVQSKMEMAYGSAWDLQMPKWLGIYWAGGTENGFHALPILSSGATLWAGSLGTRCSFGCIVLGTQEAAWLYDWAEIGTVVIIER